MVASGCSRGDAMTDSARQKAKIWMRIAAVAAVSSLGTAGAAKMLRACNTVAEASFMSTAAAASMRSDLQNEYRSLNNETRNAVAAQVEGLQKRMGAAERRNDDDHKDLKSDTAWIRDYMLKNIKPVRQW